MSATKQIFPILQTNVIKFREKKLKNFYCLDPFTTVNIDVTGNVRLCSCSTWLPTIVGNIRDNTIEEMLNSDIAHDIRQSIRDGTYTYCNEQKCGTINNNKLLTIDQINTDDGLNNLKSTFDRVFDSTVVELPRQITISGDLICNLSCPSCRTKVITESDELKVQRADIIDNINKNLFGGSDPRSITIYLSLGGELFASPLMLKFMENFPVDRFPKTEFKIQTNGLLVKRRWNKIEHLEKNVFNITVTADSQNPTTYEKLRRGGKLVDLIENLEFIQQKKKELGFEFVLRMVLQKDNALEIEDFFNFAMQFDVDSVEYQFIQNQGTFSFAEYREINLLREDHEYHNTVVNTLRTLRDKHGPKVIIYHGTI